MYFDDKDFSQKVRFQKILWAMGCWSRIEIPIVIYEDDNKNERLQKHYLTDIDVYGEVIQPDFSVTKSIGDCKSGKNIKVFEVSCKDNRGIEELSDFLKSKIREKKIMNS